MSEEGQRADDVLAAIRERDACCGELPKHWQAQWDRRILLRLLDEATCIDGVVCAFSDAESR